MGSFDEFHFVGEAAKLVSCAADHVQSGPLQTKDLDSTNRHYYVFEGRAYMGPSMLDDAATSTITTTYSVEGENLVSTTREVLQFAVSLDGAVTMYTTCDQCEPVFFEDHDSWQGDIGHKSPWCQWVAHFDYGKLVRVDRDRCETRDEVRAKLSATGVSVIPDDDRVVKRELEKWRAGKNIGIPVV